MKSNILITATNLGKCYRIYSKPFHRIYQSFAGTRKKYYDEFWALRNVEFELLRGESIGIIGRNGSGKSTFLQLICGTLTPSEGSVACNAKVAALLELGSGFNPEFTGIENVELNAMLLGLNKNEIAAKLDDILSFADIGSFINQPVRTYSSGMQLRLAFAVIANVDADVLIIDEALSVGDAIFTQRCMRYIKSIRDTKSLLFVSHDPASISSLTSKCLWINKGQQQYFGDTNISMQKYNDFCQQEGEYRSSNFQEEKVVHQPEISLEKVTNETPHTAIVTDHIVDFRQDLLQQGFLELSYKSSIFAGGSNNSYNDGVAVIQDVAWLNKQNETVSQFTGGNIITLSILWSVNIPLKSPLVGFQILDSRGLVLFGENSFSLGFHENLIVYPKRIYRCQFELQWPWLNFGEYSMTLAIASGDAKHHINHIWLYDAVIIQPTPNTRVPNGIFSPPFVRIEICEVK